MRERRGRNPRLLLLHLSSLSLPLSPLLRLIRRLRCLENDLVQAIANCSDTGGVASVQDPAGRAWLESLLRGRGEGRGGSLDAPPCHQGRSNNISNRFTLGTLGYDFQAILVILLCKSLTQVTFPSLHP